MGNVWRVFARDAKRLAKTPAAWSVALFLMVLPSLYTWFNVAGFWNPYENTSALEICVVNEDAGCDDETIGHLDVGAQVVGQLEENDQLGWMFCDYTTAMDEVSSGRAYAAFVIPAEFSENIASLVGGDFEQPILHYYVNEKTGPVAPKITDTGAGALETSVNDAFFSTVSSTVANVLNERVDEARLGALAAKSSALDRVTEALASVRDSRRALEELANTLSQTSDKATSARADLEEAKGAIDTASAQLAGLSRIVGDASSALISYTTALDGALDSSSAELSRALSETSAALTQTRAAIETAKDLLVIEPEGDLGTLVEALERAAGSIADVQAPLDTLLADTLSRTDAFRSQVSEDTAPAVSASLGQISGAASAASATISSQKFVVDQMKLVLSQLSDTLGLSQEALSRTDATLATLEGGLEDIANDLATLDSASRLEQLVGEGGIDADKVAEFMSSPTQVQTEELYPINAYGSAMAPLFINLTLWIGVFMLMVIIRLEVDDEGIERLTITQRFLGRGMLLAIMATIQSAVCCTGCLVMGVQSENVALFYLTAAIASIAYLAIQYTLSTTMQHIGKAICIILVFVQIPGATGLYPIEMTPEFFQFAYPLFPFTYGINAMRETISGFYGTLWANNVGVLLGFMAAFAVAGALARPYLANLNRMFAREIEQSDLIVGETVELPARRYRLSQIINAFTDREEYRAEIDARVKRYLELYPILKGIAVVAGVGVPLALTTVLSLVGAEKVVILNSWLVWLMLIVVYLIVVEYLRDYLMHLMSLESMSADEFRAVYAERNRLTRVKPIEVDSNANQAQGVHATSTAVSPSDGPSPKTPWEPQLLFKRPGEDLADRATPASPPTPTSHLSSAPSDSARPDEGGKRDA